MRAGSFLHGIALIFAASGAAVAQPGEPVKTGVQDAPPTTGAQPSLEQERDGRRAVRGCPVDADCKPDDALRAFELAKFPQPGTDPWIDDRAAPRGTEAVTTPVTRPSELRPDLPWLDELELPDLPIVWSAKLIDYLEFYKDDPHGHNIMAGWLRDQGRYRDLILTHLRKAKLPEDLLYVAMIESGYDPAESSYAGAAGLWQFMPEGGRIYGLRIDRWVDERNDPLRATIAVLDYFTDLYQRFGDWHLALAAFNAGYGAVLRSVARYNTNDFYKLSEIENGLPWSTTLYVPKALAAAICGHNRAVLGFDKREPAPAEKWEEVTVPSSISLATIAKAIGVGADDVKRLNPHLRRGRTPPGETGYVVRVPRGTSETFPRKLADLRSEWDKYDAYVVAHGERFEDVATTFGISTGKLKALNEITSDAEVGGGSVLVVPRIDAAKRAKNRDKAVAALHASGPDQKPGEPLIVAVPDKDAAVDGKRRVFYRVVSGDTLAEVADALGVATAKLVAWNDLSATADLHARMVLQAWVAEDFDAAAANVRLLDDDKLLVVTRGSDEHLDLAEARVGRERIEYKPKKAESLEAIGKKFGLGPRDLARINKMKSTSVIEPGQTIIVYKVVDKDRSDRAAKQWKNTPRDQKQKPKAKGKQGRVAGPVTSPDQLEEDDSDSAGDAAGDPAHP
jgi:membrane-bound lytic murein transglycosylase D